MAPPISHKPRWHAAYLDALRGIAALAVILVHVGATCPLPAPWVDIAYSGQRGVQLFFLVSAFTLTLSQQNRRDLEHHPTRNFFLRRLFRLAPMYYVAILLACLFDPVTAGTWQQRVLGLCFLQGFGPAAILHVAAGAWTVADEALFYALLPLLARQIRSLRSALISLAVAGPLMAALSLYAEHHDPVHKLYFAFFWFPVELPVFLLGIASYYLWQQHLSTRITPGSRMAATVSLLLLLASLAIYRLNLPLNNRKIYFGAAGYALLLLALALKPWSFLVNRFTVFVGRISFSIYLLHFWVLALVLRWSAGFPAITSPLSLLAVRLSATVLLSILVAFVTWRFVEEPGIQAGRFVIARLEGRRGSVDLSRTHPLRVPIKSASPEEQF